MKLNKNMVMAATAAALMLSACGGQKAAETTAAETTAEETTVDESLEEALMEDDGYFSGIVTGMADGQISVLSDEGETYSFDMTGAETDPDYDILPGAYVEVSYEGLKEEGGVTKAVGVSVLMSLEEEAAEKGEDPALQGTVKDYSTNLILVTDPNGKDHEFDSSIAQVLSKSGITEGTQVMVTYYGTIEEDAQDDTEEGDGAGTPIAIRIVTPDSAGEAGTPEMSGSVLYVEGDRFTIETDAGDFEFLGDASLLSGITEGDNVVVTYTGSVNSKTITATAVTKQ